MKIKSFVICLILLLPLAALADEKNELAREIIELTRVKQIIEQLKGQVKQIEHQLLGQFEIPEGKKEIFVDYQNKLNDKVFEIMSYDEMEKEYLDLFTSTYTTAELKGLVAFYKSPVGKSMIEKQPQIIEKAMMMSQRRMQVLIPELQKISAEFEQALKK